MPSSVCLMQHHNSQLNGSFVVGIIKIYEKSAQARRHLKRPKPLQKHELFASDLSNCHNPLSWIFMRKLFASYFFFCIALSWKEEIYTFLLVSAQKIDRFDNIIFGFGSDIFSTKDKWIHKIVVRNDVIRKVGWHDPSPWKNINCLRETLFGDIVFQKEKKKQPTFVISTVHKQCLAVM